MRQLSFVGLALGTALLCGTTRSQAAGTYALLQRLRSHEDAQVCEQTALSLS